MTVFSELMDFLKGKYFLAREGMDCYIEDINERGITFRIPECYCWDGNRIKHRNTEALHILELEHFNEPTLELGDGYIVLRINYYSGFLENEVRAKHPWFFGSVEHGYWVGTLYETKEETDAVESKEISDRRQ